MSDERLPTDEELKRRDDIYGALCGNDLTHAVAEFLANLEGRVHRLEKEKEHATALCRMFKARVNEDGKESEAAMNKWEECPQHDWEVRSETDIGGNRTDVICRNCGVPGEQDDETGKVYYPAT